MGFICKKDSESGSKLDLDCRKIAPMIEGKIGQLLESKFSEEAFRDCFLIEVNLKTNNKLEVFIDRDKGLSIDICRKISRYLEETLDAELWLGEKYTLEVSSPGVDRPLKLKRQYKKNIGRNFEVKVKNEEKVQKGKLIAMTDESITLEYTVKIKEGKKKREEIVQAVIPFDQIEKAKVKISFK